MNEDFCWTPLENCTSSMSEANLQSVFDDWPESRNGWRIVGAPNWLLHCKARKRPPPFDVRGYGVYSFTPDVMWCDPHCYVVELKRAAKYEPLALAEVLHHAWHLGDPSLRGSEFSKAPVPVMVVTDGEWLRAALNYLFDHGLRTDALRLPEVAFYKTESGDRYLWFEEPFTKRTPDEGTPNL